MPDVDDAHAGLVRRIVDREDVATGEREEFPYAERGQTGEGELTSMSLDRSSMPLDRSSVSLDRLGHATLLCSAGVDRPRSHGRSRSAAVTRPLSVGRCRTAIRRECYSRTPHAAGTLPEVALAAPQAYAQQ